MSPLVRRMLEKLKSLGLPPTKVAALAGLAVFFLANLGLADVSAGTPKTPQVSERFEKAIDKASVFFTLPDAMADQMLTQVGFDHPGITNEEWRQLSAYHRLETAYWCAEAAAPERGGSRRRHRRAR